MQDLANSEIYDRQTRLWGVHGQRNIINSTIFSLGSDTIATEVLKSLVLTAFGHIIIVDDAKVDEDDIKTNFYVEQSDLGKSRAEAAKRLLQELNPAAKFDVIEKSPEDPSVLSSIPENAIVVSTGVRKSSFIEAVDNYCRAHNNKYVHVESIGFFGQFYIDAQIRYFLEATLSADSPKDFRILNPFPELKEFFESINLDTIDDTHHDRLPYIVILYNVRKSLEKSTGRTKFTSKDLDLIREEIKKFARNLVEFSYNEATQDANLVYGDCLVYQTSITSALSLLDEIPADLNLPFFRLLRSVKKFIDAHHEYPHYGLIPDMEAHPDYFNALKKIYKEKADKDWAEIIADAEKTGEPIDPFFIKRFRENIWRLGGSISKPMIESLKSSLMVYNDITYSVCQAHLAIEAVREFYEKKGVYPKKEDSKEIDQIMKTLGAFLQEQYPNDNSIKYAESISLMNGKILPSVVATIAACAAQEIVKLAIDQNEIIRNGVAFDALQGQMLPLPCF